MRRGMVLAAAAALLVAAFFVLRGRSARDERPVALGQDARGTLTNTPGPALVEPEYEEGGEVLFRWSEVSGADEYQLQILAPDHTEIAKFPPGPSASRLLQPEEIPSGYPRGTTLLWVVTAFYGGTPIARSIPGPFRVR